MVGPHMRSTVVYSQGGLSWRELFIVPHTAFPRNRPRAGYVRESSNEGGKSVYTDIGLIEPHFAKFAGRAMRL
jgi:hypothetical protein